MNYKDELIKIVSADEIKERRKRLGIVMRLERRVMLSKHQRRKLERYGKVPCFSSAELLFNGEVKEVWKKIYKKPRRLSMSEAERKKLILLT